MLEEILMIHRRWRTLQYVVCYSIAGETWDRIWSRGRRGKDPWLGYQLPWSTWPPGSKSVPGHFQYLNIAMHADAVLGILLRLFLIFNLLWPRRSKDKFPYWVSIGDLALKDEILATATILFKIENEQIVQVSLWFFFLMLFYQNSIIFFHIIPQQKMLSKLVSMETVKFQLLPSRLYLWPFPSIYTGDLLN